MTDAAEPRSRRPATPFLWGVPIGAAGGLIGLGGAEFRLPVLVGPLGFRARQAVPLNLAVSFATIAAALIARSGGIPTAATFAPDLLSLALGAAGAAFIGAGWARGVSERQLRGTIFVLLIAIGVALILEAFVSTDTSGFLPDDVVTRAIAGVVFGLGIGLLSSVLGVAGGEVIIPTLVFVFGVDIKTAGTASLLVSLPTVLIGIARYRAGGAYPDSEAMSATVLPMAAGSVVGAIVGGLASGIVPAQVLKVALGLVLIWSAQRVFRHSQTSP